MNSPTQTRQSGFTVLELIFVAVILCIAGALIFIQFNNLKTANDDSQRKTAINAIHYALEEVYYEEHKSYPASLQSSTLPSVDPKLFTDPDGFTLGKAALSEEELQQLVDEGDVDEDARQRLIAVSSGKEPNYHYDGTNCDTMGNCKSYTLRADLSNEAQYVKKNRQR